MSRDEGSELGREWLGQREVAMAESRGRCTRCGDRATTWNLSLTGAAVARCSSCHAVDVAAAGRQTAAGEARGATSPRPSQRPPERTADFHVRGSGGPA